MSTRESPSSSTHRAVSKGRWPAVSVVLLALVLVIEFSFGIVSSALSGTTHAVTLETDTESARAGDVGVEPPRAESDEVAANDRQNNARERRSSTLSARLVDPEGNALEGLVVDAIAVDEEHRFDRQPGAAVVLARATSSRDGRIVVPMSQEGYVALALRGQPFVLADRFCHFAVSESDVDVGDLACRRASSLTGTVVDASGTPVVNAECHAWIDTTMDAVVTRTDAQGSFVLAGFSSLPSKVTARAAGHGIAHATPVDFETPLVLRLDYLRTAVLTVKHFDSDRLIENATVERVDLPAGMNRSVRRRADGRFELDETSSRAVLRCSASGYATVQADVRSENSEVEVCLEELTTVEGRVVDQNGDGVACNRIELSVEEFGPLQTTGAFSSTVGETWSVATDDAGRFAFPGVAAG
ncbi:MAG: carboxypeptidase regulatory-like domain-containing protein [Planctomycetes bacterium]|nr:carboxypeptidase regulatory-like domain-containing protein [Planctomycetota bacterium]